MKPLYYNISANDKRISLFEMIKVGYRLKREDG